MEGNYRWDVTSCVVPAAPSNVAQLTIANSSVLEVNPDDDDSLQYTLPHLPTPAILCSVRIIKIERL
jgi:hypothetical protein